MRPSRVVASVLLVGLPVVLLVVVVAVARTTDTKTAGGKPTGGVSAQNGSGSGSWRAIGPKAFAAAGCERGAAITSGFFQLGPTFRGLSASHYAVECMPARSRIAVDGPLRPVGYVYLTYGSCNYRLEPCHDPLEIQTWAECARDPNSYTPERGPSRGQQPVLNPEELVKIGTIPELPATSFNDGTRIELYGGGSTVVVFAPDATLAKQAARALARAVFVHASPTTAARLDAEAAAPGNASTCHHLLAPVLASREQR